MLIDEFLPKYDFVETHDVMIWANAETVYNSMWNVDICDSKLVSWLFFLRGLPSRKNIVKATG